jgi:hypothetical protein
MKARSQSSSNEESERHCTGDEECQCEIYDSLDSQRSSFLDLLSLHTCVASRSHYVDKEPTSVTTLDRAFEQFYRQDNSVFSKSDGQGLKKKIIHGAKNTLDRIGTIQLELSIVPLYNALEVLQVDAIFQRHKQ